MEAFVEMRKFIAGNAALFQRLDKVDHKQIEADEKFDRIFSALEKDQLKPEKGIFFYGQVYYPPDKQQKAIDTVLKQAELMADLYLQA